MDTPHLYFFIIYYLYNGHGDVTTIVNGSGAVTAGYYYDAFGVQLDVSGNVSNPYRYSGYVYDSETNLYYLNARFYSAETARFLQEDSYRGNIGDPLSLNLYAYVNYNPLIYYDPTGHALAGNGTMTAVDRLAISRAQEQYDKSYAIYSSDKYTTAARENAYADMLSQMAIIDKINQAYLKEYEAWLKTQPTSTKDSDVISDMPTIVVTVVVENSSSTSTSKTTQIEKTYTYTVLNRIMYEVVGSELIRVETDVLVPLHSSLGNSLESDVYVMSIISEVIVKDIVSKMGSAGTEIAHEIAIILNETSHSSTYSTLSKAGDSDPNILPANGKKDHNPLTIFFKYLTREGYADWFLSLTLAAKKDEKTGVYSIDQDYWQSFDSIGYKKFYDLIFDTFTSMNKDTFDFNYDNKDFRIWVWKGDYINLGAGAELGIYYKGWFDHWNTGTDYRMPMTLELYEYRALLFTRTPEEYNWWITGFMPARQNVYAEDLTAIYTLNFSKDDYHKDMFKAFLRDTGINYDKNGSKWTFDEDSYIATLTFSYGNQYLQNSIIMLR